MSKQNAIITIIIIFFCITGSLIWFYFLPSFKSTNTEITETDNTDVYDPFGTIAQDNSNINETDTSDDGENMDPSEFAIPTKLRQISEEPVSGYSVIKNLKTQKTDIRYILRANGNIYETYTDSLEQKRLSITTIPKVYESNWLPDGEKLIIRYLDENKEDIQTFSVKINPATTTLNEFEGGIDGNHLAKNITSISINPKGDKIFYLTKGLKGSSGFISKSDGLNKKTVFESPLNEWVTSWPKEDTITLNTKPSAKVPGYLYFLNSVTGSLSRIIGNIEGLTTKTNKTATEVLYSDSIRIIPRLYLYNIKKGESKLLPWNTLPEKCVWSENDNNIIYCAVPKAMPTGDYPDLWYKGLVDFTDSFWTINTNTGASTLLYDIEKETTKKMDVVEPKIDANNEFLFFIDKNTLTLWSYDLR